MNGLYPSRWALTWRSGWNSITRHLSYDFSLILISLTNAICYKTEQDFAEIAGLSYLLEPCLDLTRDIAAGLNWVRIPLGFWAVETINNEPFLARTSWTYFLKASVLPP